MKTAFLWIRTILSKLWRTVTRTFVRRHLRMEDVDGDKFPEIILDINGYQETESNFDDPCCSNKINNDKEE